MATVTLYLTGYEGYFDWQIGTASSGLSNPFNTTYYTRAGVCTRSFSDGASSISGIVSSVYATSSGTKYYVRGDDITYSAGTHYFYGFVQAANGKYYCAGEGSVTITQAMTEPTVGVPSSTATTITARFSAKGDYRYFGIALLNSSRVTVVSNNGPTTSISRTFTGLSPNTTYIVRYYWYSSSSSSSLVDYYDWPIATQQATPPTVYVSSKTSNSITVYISDMGDYSYLNFSLLQGSTTIVSFSGTNTYYSDGSTKTFTGLSPNTTYTIKYRYSVNSTSYSGTGTLSSIVTEKISVSKWSWSTSNGSATASQTSAAYTAITNKGATSNFSYKVWNDMVDKIAEIRRAYSSSVLNIGEWDTHHASLANTKMSSSDKKLTAIRFNSLRYNIGSAYSGGSGVQEVKTGDIVYGSYFTTIMSKANAWIDTL